MDENLYHYYMSSECHARMLREADRARLVAQLMRLRRRRVGGYPLWLARLLAWLSDGLITAGLRLHKRLNRPGNQAELEIDPARRFSYGD